MRKMEVVGVRVEMPTNQPIVLLKEVQGERYLPIWIGPVEATAIAFAQQGMVPARPLTHDLFRDVLEALGVQLNTVNITALRDGIFFADLIFSNGKEVSARPSDSIALALRTGASIFASEEILDEAGVAIPDEQEDEVEKFREFLDTISPEDFGLVRRGGGRYGPDALAAARAVVALDRYGVQARHLRVLRASAERETALIEQVVAPMLRQRSDGARDRAGRTAREIAAITLQLHAALIEAALADAGFGDPRPGRLDG